MTTIFVIISIILIALYLVYMTLVMKKNKVREALAGIDVQLKKRYDLIPNVLFLANKFMEHERGLIEDITKLRTKAAKIKSDFDNVSEKIALDNEIKTKMGQLMVSVENYPQLKSDQTMIQAMQTYSEVEEHIAAARRFYNSAVLDLTNAVEILPSKWFAQKLGIKSELPYFEITEEKERQAVNANEFFS
ncbi:MAG: LemA family protein [Cyanobacteria bacterium SIG32]|nr:LemA family protein [Cyanobacteria bacterium SIG32]